jgi:hypothetical protein
VIWALTGHSTGGGGVPWPVWVSAIWGFFLATDVFKVYGPVARTVHARISEAEIQRQTGGSTRFERQRERRTFGGQAADAIRARRSFRAR